MENSESNCFYIPFRINTDHKLFLKTINHLEKQLTYDVNSFFYFFTKRKTKKNILLYLQVFPSKKRVWVITSSYVEQLKTKKIVSNNIEDILEAHNLFLLKPYLKKII
jgi:hypothetical protein